jgi:putative endopeptidase
MTDNREFRRNFYEAVNGRWLEDPANAIPAEYPRWGGFVQLHDQGLKNQIALVQELCGLLETDPAELNESQLKIAATWDASFRRFKSWDEGTANYDPILSELKHLADSLSEFSIQGVAEYLHYTQINGVGNLFDFDKESDFKNTENVVLDLNTSGLSLPTRDYYLDDKFADKREAYVTHLNRVRDLITNAGGDLSESFAADILSFETEMAVFKMSPEQQRRFTEYYTDTTLCALQSDGINDLCYLPEKEEHYDESDRNYRISEEMIGDVKQFFDRLYLLFGFRDVMDKNRKLHYTGEDGEIRADAPGPEQLYVWDGDGLRRMLRLVLNPDNFVRYRSYLQYQVIAANKAYTTQEMDEEFFDFYSRQLSGTQEQQPRDKRTINVINAYCGELMGQVFVQKYFPPSHKTQMMELITGVRESMGVAIRENDWLEDPTKRMALEKLELFTPKIGYPDVWKDYSDLTIEAGDSMYDISKKVKVWALDHEFYRKLNAPRDPTEWGMTPQTVNAYYHPLHNEIVFPAAILQPPFFMTDAGLLDFDIEEEQNATSLDDRLTLYAANCGGIAAVIAHEITHGYDDKGRQFDGHGTKVDWWTEEDSKMFKQKAQLMNTQAERCSFTIDEETYKMNPELTMGENLADLGGLSLALRTLNAELNKSVTDESVVRVYHRIFFKSFANIWRQNTTDQCRIKLISVDPHAPTDFRANLVANIDEFYDAFEVVEGDEMYLSPSERLNMW